MRPTVRYAQLSPHEDATLCRIAGGAVKPHDFREADTRRLIALGLVQKIDGALTVTKAGADRCTGRTTFVLRQEQQEGRL
jgi:hypothetical protein